MAVAVAWFSREGSPVSPNPSGETDRPGARRLPANRCRVVIRAHRRHPSTASAAAIRSLVGCAAGSAGGLFQAGFDGVGLPHQGPVCCPAADARPANGRTCPPIRPPKSDPAQRRINGSSPRRHGRRSQAHRPLLPRCRWRSPRPGSRTSTLRLPDVMVDDHRLTGRCFQDADGDLRDQARERPRPPARPAVQHMQLHRLDDRRQLRVVCGRGRNPTVRVFTLNVGRHVATLCRPSSSASRRWNNTAVSHRR